jgi:hypothetical protein
MVNKSSKKTTKTPRSSSLGPSTRSATKSNRTNTIDSDGFTTVTRKGDTNKSLSVPTLNDSQRKQLSVSSPSSFDQDHVNDVNSHHASIHAHSTDHSSTNDPDHNASAVTHWQQFTSGSGHRSTHDHTHHAESTRPTSQPSSEGLSYSDDSNRVNQPVHFHQDSIPNDSIIDVHRFKTMESQLAIMMDFIKKSEHRHNEQLLQHGNHIKSQLSKIFPTNTPVISTTHSCGTHIPHAPNNAPPSSSSSTLHPGPLNPTAVPKPSDTTVHQSSSNRSSHSTQPKFESHNPNQSSTLFGQSDFSIACNGKVKFLEIERYMKDKQLGNDSVQQLEIFYTDIMSAIGYAFEFHLSFIPDFKDLRPDINFEKLFLANLCGSTLQKAQSTFDRIGQIIKKFLTAPFVQDSKAPLASIVLKSNNKLPGWKLFVTLLQARVVLCGATPDYDLDTVRTAITYQDGESFHNFYSRNQDLLNEYELTYADQLYIPTFKITYRFVTELCRSMDFLIHLSQYQHALIIHLQKYGDANNLILPPCSIQEVYEMLVRVRAPSVPTTLNSVTYLPPPSVTPVNKSVSPDPVAPSPGIIANLEISPSCQHPEICSMVTPKQRCQACLRGVHDPNNCYLRGPAFRPTELNQRLNNYNQQFGDKPPKGHVPPEYKPLGLPAMHAKKSNLRTSKFAKKPFTGSTKIKLNDQKSSIHAIEHDNDDDDNSDEVVSDPDPHPYVGSFVQEEDAFYDQQLDSNTNDICDTDPTICMLASPSLSVPTSNAPRFLNDAFKELNVTDMVHPDITERIQKYHHNKGNRPCGLFVRHHHDNLQRIPPNCFEPFCNISLMADGGANVWALTDRRCFYFYIPQPSSITQAGGSGMPSKAWGGVLVQFGDSVYLVAPVYHCPQNPRNTFSPGVLIDFCNFQRVVIDTHRSVNMHDNNGKIHNLPISIHNNLDYVDIKILTLRSHQLQQSSLLPSPGQPIPVNPTICSQHLVHPRRSPRLLQQQMKDPSSQLISSSSPTINPPSPPQLTSSSSSSIDLPSPPHGRKLISIMNPRIEKHQEFSVPKEALMTIIHFYVDLHPSPSPRTLAIRNINLLLGHPVLSATNYPSKHNQSPSNNVFESISPMINNLYSATSSSVSNHEKYLFLHEGLMHSSKGAIQTMIRRQLLTDLPSIKVTDFICSCDTCNLAKAKKIPRGLEWDITHLSPFQLIHLDFSFFSEKSIRGFTTALDVTCASTSYPIGFPTKSKAPPIQSVQWLIRSLRNRGFSPCFCHVDEGGELANSSEFCQMLVNEGLVMSTTGGGNSANNGKVERPNQTKANMIRSMLATMKSMFGSTLPKGTTIQQFWCFAYQHANFILRRTYNAARDEIPMFLVHKKRPSALELVIPGSIMTVINPNKNLLPKLSENRARTCNFLCYGNHVKTHIYWDQSTSSYKRSYHSVIDTTATLAKLKEHYHFNTTVPEEAQCTLTTPNLLPMFSRVKTPFPLDTIHSVRITLPPYPQPIGLVLEDDALFNLPYIRKAIPNTPAFSSIPPTYRRNHFILHVNGDSPISSHFVRTCLQEIQKSPKRDVVLDLVHRAHGDQRTSLAITRAMFDQLPRFHNQQSVISSLDAIPDTHRHFITAPSKPPVPKTIFDALKGPFRENWKAAAYIQFNKNQQVATFTLPFPKHELPHGSNVFRSTLVPEIKATDIPGVYELRVRECTIGTPQKQGIDFDNSYSPVAEITTIRVMIALSASLGYTFGIMDVKNAFQTTITQAKDRIYVNLPPLYREWLQRQNIYLDKDQVYYRQCLNANQGRRDAGQLWYQLLASVLLKYGCVKSTIDHGFFVKSFPDGAKLYIALATDDLLCGFPSFKYFIDLKRFLEKYFVLKEQVGPVLNFLGLRIIQSDDCITIDQGEYIYDLLHHYYGDDLDKIKTVTSPMRSDNDFEKELFESPPLSDDELKEFSIKYRGSYRYHTGKFMHASVQTRFDIAFATQRLSEYNSAPTKSAFEGIGRVYRYLAQDVIRPLCYPRNKLEGKSLVTMHLSPDNTMELEVSNQLTAFGDAEFARCLASRRTYVCVVIVLLNVAVYVKIVKTSVMQHTTDSEITAHYLAVRFLKPIRRQFEVMGFPIMNPSDNFTDNSSVDAITAAGRMTRRCRHIDVPIAYLHQERDITFVTRLIRTCLMLADFGTKANVPAILKRFKYWACGHYFLPKQGTAHYDHLDLQFYEMTYIAIITILKKKETRN